MTLLENDMQTALVSSNKVWEESQALICLVELRYRAGLCAMVVGVRDGACWFYQKSLPVEEIDAFWTNTHWTLTHTHKRGVFIHLFVALLLSGCAHTYSACFVKSDILLCRHSTWHATKSGFQIR